jgi:hypothetical protein
MNKHDIDSDDEQDIVNQEGPENKDNLDNLTKKELIKKIQDTKIEKIDYSSKAYKNTIKNIKLENEKLLTLSIELYNKLKTGCENYVEEHEDILESEESNISDVRDFRKKFSNVAPEFNQEEAIVPETVFDENKPILDDQEEIKTEFNFGPITLEEFNNSFRENNKSKQDMSGLSFKMIEDLSDFNKRIIIREFNKIIANPELVKENNFGKMVLAYKESKKGPVDKFDSFRTITAIPNIMSLFHRILTLRLNKFCVENNIIDTTIQKAGISGMKNSLLTQIIKVKNIIKINSRVYSIGSVLNFIDIKNAFPSLHINNVCRILKLYNINDNFLNYLKTYYSSFEYYIKAKNWTTELKFWKSGLVQGCPLSQLLFVFVLNHILKHLNKKYINKGGKFNANQRILFIAYVDDIVLITENIKDNEQIFLELQKLLSDVGLEINLTKTNYMITGNVLNPKYLQETLNIELVKKFKYLGEFIYDDCSLDKIYNSIKYVISNKLHYLERTQAKPENMINYINCVVLPFLQKKLAVLYDLSHRNKLVLANIIKEFIEKHKLNINTDLKYVLNIEELKEQDDVIAGIEFDLDNTIELEDCEISIRKLKQVEYNKENELDRAVEDRINNQEPNNVVA